MDKIWYGSRTPSSRKSKGPRHLASAARVAGSKTPNCRRLEYYYTLWLVAATEDYKFSAEDHAARPNGGHLRAEVAALSANDPVQTRFAEIDALCPKAT